MISIDTHIQGLIFDLDGTLIDTMWLHYLAWQETLQEVGGNFPEPLFRELAGAPSDKLVETLNQKFGYQLDPLATVEKKEQRFLDVYLSQAKPVEPVVNLAKAYKSRLPMAVATGGIPLVATAALKVIGMDDFFDTLVTSTDVKHCKPAPDTFLEAAHRLKVDPQHCIVFEDGDLGLEGARRAGMQAVDVRIWLNQ